MIPVNIDYWLAHVPFGDACDEFRSSRVMNLGSNSKVRAQYRKARYPSNGSRHPVCVQHQRLSRLEMVSQSTACWSASLIPDALTLAMSVVM